MSKYGNKKAQISLRSRTLCSPLRKTSERYIVQPRGFVKEVHLVIIRRQISQFFHKNVVDTHQKRLVEALLMSIHNIFF